METEIRIAYQKINEMRAAGIKLYHNQEITKQPSE